MYTALHTILKCSSQCVLYSGPVTPASYLLICGSCIYTFNGVQSNIFFSCLSSCRGVTTEILIDMQSHINTYNTLTDTVNSGWNSYKQIFWWCLLHIVYQAKCMSTNAQNIYRPFNICWHCSTGVSRTYETLHMQLTPSQSLRSTNTEH